MRPVQWLGVLFIAAGIAGLAYERFTYTETKEVVDLGPVEINQEEKHSIPIPTIVGIAVLLGGIAMLLAAPRASS